MHFAFCILHSAFLGNDTLDYKRLLTKVEKTLSQIDTTQASVITIGQLAETIAANFRDELGISGGRVYQFTDELDYELVGRFGSSRGQLGIRVPRNYKPVELVLETRGQDHADAVLAALGESGYAAEAMY